MRQIERRFIPPPGLIAERALREIWAPPTPHFWMPSRAPLIAPVVPLQAVVGHSQTVGATATAATSVASPTITDVDDAFYIAAIQVRNDIELDSVANTGGLTFTEIVAACPGRQQTGTYLYGAFGSPTGDFTVTANVASTTNSLGIVVSSYTGADTGGSHFEDASFENENGDGGACTGATDGNPYTLTMVGTVDNNVHYAAVFHRSAGDTGDPTGYTQRGNVEVTGGGGGEQIHIEVFDQAFVTAQSDQVSCADGNSDWCVAGCVVIPAVAAGGGIEILRRRIEGHA